jgi:hypothetical protein
MAQILKFISIQMELIIRTFDLQLQHTFSISRKSINVQPTVRIKVTAYQVMERQLQILTIIPTVDILINDLEKTRPIIEKKLAAINTFFGRITSLSKKTIYSPVLTLDVAYTDLYARKQNKKLFSNVELFD